MSNTRLELKAEDEVEIDFTTPVITLNDKPNEKSLDTRVQAAEIISMSAYLPLDAAYDLINRYIEKKTVEWKSDPKELLIHTVNTGIQFLTNTFWGKPITPFVEIPHKRKLACQTLLTRFKNIADATDVNFLILDLYHEAFEGYRDKTWKLDPNNDAQSQYLNVMYASIRMVRNLFKKHHPKDYEKNLQLLKEKYSTLATKTNETKQDENVQEFVYGNSRSLGEYNYLRLLAFYDPDNFLRLAFKVNLFRELPYHEMDTPKQSETGIRWRNVTPQQLKQNYDEFYFETILKLDDQSLKNITFNDYLIDPKCWLLCQEELRSLAKKLPNYSCESQTSGNENLQKKLLFAGFTRFNPNARISSPNPAPDNLDNNYESPKP